MEPSTFQEGSGCQRRTVVSCRSVHSSLGKAGQQQTDCRRLQRRKTPRTRSSKLAVITTGVYSSKLGCDLDGKLVRSITRSGREVHVIEPATSTPARHVVTVIHQAQV